MRGAAVVPSRERESEQGARGIASVVLSFHPGARAQLRWLMVMVMAALLLRPLQHHAPLQVTRDEDGKPKDVAEVRGRQ